MNEPLPRVLVVAANTMRTFLVEHLEAEGFAVLASDGDAELSRQLADFKPSLVVLDEQVPGRAGRQVALTLRAKGPSFSVPMVGVLSDRSAVNVLGWLRVGVVDLWSFPFAEEVGTRARELISECTRTSIQAAPMKTRLLRWAERGKLEATVVTNPGTPFEGRATFVNGELAGAQFGELVGDAALDQLLDHEEGQVVWEDMVPPSVTMQRAHDAGFRGKVLLVEDDVSLRRLVTKQLEAAHFVVESAGDGIQGLQLAARKHFDVVVCDLDLPQLDGWGLLRELRDDLTMREISALVLSAHEEAVDTLKAARAGARAYLKKSGRAKELLDTITLLATPRATVWESLRSSRDTRVELRSVGPLWLVRTLAELDCAGQLRLEDELGRYELTIAEGQLVGASGLSGTKRLEGREVLEAIVAGRATGAFVFKPTVAPEGAPWLFELVDDISTRLRESEGAKFSAAVSNPAALFLNEDLASLFARIATVSQLKVLDAVKAAADDLETLSQVVQLPKDEVQAIVAELLHRGVLVTGE